MNQAERTLPKVDAGVADCQFGVRNLQSKGRSPLIKESWGGGGAFWRISLDKMVLWTPAAGTHAQVQKPQWAKSLDQMVSFMAGPTSGEKI